MNFLEQLQSFEERQNYYQQSKKYYPENPIEQQLLSFCNRTLPTTYCRSLLKKLKKKLMLQDKALHAWFCTIQKDNKQIVIQPGTQFKDLLKYQSEDGFIYIEIQQIATFG